MTAKIFSTETKCQQTKMSPHCANMRCGRPLAMHIQQLHFLNGIALASSYILRCLSVVSHLSYSCPLLKPFDGFRCHLAAGYTYGVQWHIVLDNPQW